MKPPLDAMAALFQALGDPTRLRILGLLLTGRCASATSTRACAFRSRKRRGIWPICAARAWSTRGATACGCYYRLAEAGDPVGKTLRQAVTRALGDIETVRRDTGRLQKKVGLSSLPPQVCPPVVVDRLHRRRRGLPPHDYSERSKIHPTAAPAATSQVGLIE